MVVALDLGVIPSPAGSGELLIADEDSYQLVFVTAAIESPSRVGVATFRGCRQVVFGYPNDEAQPGHPLHQSADGWTYGFYEVVGSDWPKRLETQNRVVFPTRTPPWGQRHFIVVCHENLVEVLADDVVVDLHDRVFEEVALDALRRILR
jgi:hypothetical protein